MAKRYEQLYPLIRACKPQTIAEVGVHRGMRAMMMAEEALKASPSKPVRYIGFDVFELMSQAFHDAALNGKGIPQRAIAEARMQSVKERFETFSWNFCVGDTRETLHGKRIACDFAFIDGDHRVEAIRGDALGLDCPLMVFDDYYIAGPDGRLPDLALYGANVVVDELKAAGASVELLPAGDLCNHGGIALLAVVRR